MSYAKLGQGSDVYVYASMAGGEDCWVCCFCKLGADDSPTEHEDTFIARTPGQMLAHLEKHDVAGDKVPDGCIARLLEEIPDPKGGGG